MNTPIRNRKGFTLIELLTVIAIIGILAAVLFPGVQGVMRSAKKNSALNKVRSIGQAYMNWAGGNKAIANGTWVSLAGISTPPPPAPSWAMSPPLLLGRAASRLLAPGQLLAPRPPILSGALKAVISSTVTATSPSARIL